LHSDSEIRLKPSAAAPAPRRAAFVFVFVTVLLDMLALGIIIPVLPKLVAISSAAMPPRVRAFTACSAPPGR
jgi:hypothetical protein